MQSAKSLAVSGKIDKNYAEQNVKFIESNLIPLEPILKDEKAFSKVSQTIGEMVRNFKADLQNRANDLKKTKISNIKESSILEQDRKTGEESNVESGQFEGPAFDRSKEAMDAALAFTGEITRDKYTKLMAEDPQVQKFEKTANDLLVQAKNLQLVDRKGLKIVTAGGTQYKRKDYKVKIDSLINEIIRQKKEYRRIKDLLLTKAEISYTPQPIPVVVVPKPEVKDETKPTPTPTPTGKCTFPVRVGSAKCEEVQKLQTKIMELFPAIATFLESRGKADGKYGKGTSKCVNIILGYLNKNKDISLVGDLTKDGYDSIMALEEKDIERKIKTIDSAAKESIGFDKYLKDRIFEAEFNEGVPVLRFDSFAQTISKNPSYKLVAEEDKSKTIGYKIPEECLNKSIETEQIDLECIKAKKDEGGEGEKKNEEIIWKGYKPVRNGAYTVYYDESWSEWWGDFSKGAIVAGILVGAVIVTAGAAGIAIPVGGTLLGASSLGASGLAGAVGAAGSLGTTAGAITLASGAVGGSTIAKWVGSDRQPVTVLVFNGYIENIAVNAMARGLSNSLKGTVSSQDLLAIMSTLVLCRGTYTDNGDGKAVSAWSQIKKNFQTYAGESIESSIQGIVGEEGIAGFFKDIVTDMDEIPALPRFKTKDPLTGSPADFDNALDACKQGLAMLNKNNSKVEENIKDLKEEDLEKLSEAMEELTDGVSGEVEETEE